MLGSGVRGRSAADTPSDFVPLLEMLMPVLRWLPSAAVVLFAVSAFAADEVVKDGETWIVNSEAPRDGSIEVEPVGYPSLAVSPRGKRCYFAPYPKSQTKFWRTR